MTLGNLIITVWVRCMSKRGIYFCYHLRLYYLTDTIPGRQCMASCFFLLKQFGDVLIYLNSIKVSSFNSENSKNLWLKCQGSISQAQDFSFCCGLPMFALGDHIYVFCLIAN